ncbi:MAG: hypothetical protein FVQ81_13140 [Candidatus Glassbacteria bacterium]|nr:hypothetical protein [Candidatus Glassbacteria bacterium]
MVRKNSRPVFPCDQCGRHVVAKEPIRARPIAETTLFDLVEAYRQVMKRHASLPGLCDEGLRPPSLTIYPGKG